VHLVDKTAVFESAHHAVVNAPNLILADAPLAVRYQVLNGYEPK
jgi:hypothetical protein